MKQFARSPKDIGQAIRQARKDKNFTQKDLAVKSGVWQETISKVETGAASTKVETLFALLAALDLELAVLPRSRGSQADLEDIF